MNIPKDGPNIYQKTFGIREYIRKKMLFLKSKIPTLSKDDYNNLFCYDGSTKPSEIAQGSLNNCRLMSRINALRTKNFFEPLIRQSVIKENDSLYKVCMPLGASDGKRFSVSIDEVENLYQINEDHPGYHSNVFQDYLPYKKEEFSRKFKIGIPLLEVAMLKYIEEGNYSHNPFNDHFLNASLIKNFQTLMCSQDKEQIEKILRSFKGGCTLVEVSVSGDEQGKARIYNKNHITVTSTTGKESFLITNHSYIVSDVIINQDGSLSVIISNARDTKEMNIKINLQDFYTYFKNFKVWEIDYERIVSNYE